MVGDKTRLIGREVEAECLCQFVDHETQGILLQLQAALPGDPLEHDPKVRNAGPEGLDIVGDAPHTKS